MLNARLSALTLERARSRAFLYQVLVDAGPNRKAVFEFSRGDQELGRTLARMLREREPAPA
jgi:hypothetical protein